MRGLDPRIQAPARLALALPNLICLHGRLRLYLTNKRDGTLYIGVTNDLSRRVHEHHEKYNKGFTTRYGLNRLVYYESYDDIRLAIQREKTIKHWPRLWKLALIQMMNPDWDDLYQILNQ